MPGEGPMVREGKGWVSERAQAEGQRAARLLAEKIRDSRYSVREVEVKAGWGRKTLYQILAGRQPIRVSHMAAVAEVIGLNLSDFYRELATSRDNEEKPPEHPVPRVGTSQPPALEISPGLTEDDVLASVRDLLRRYRDERTEAEQEEDEK